MFARAREREVVAAVVCVGGRGLERRCLKDVPARRKERAGGNTGSGRVLSSDGPEEEEAKEGVHLRLRSGRSQGPASLESSRWLRAAASAAAAAGTTGVAAAAAAGSGTTGVACCAGADGA